MKYQKRVGDDENKRGFSGTTAFEFNADEFKVHVSKGGENTIPWEAKGFWITFSQGTLELTAMIYDVSPDHFEKVRKLVQDKDGYGLRLFMIDLFSYEAPLIWTSLYESGIKEGRLQLQAEMRKLLGVVQ